VHDEGGAGMSRNGVRPADPMLNPTLYCALVEQSPTPIWYCGADGTCDYFNPAWLRFTGRTLEQELADGWARGIHGEDSAHCLEILQHRRANRQPFEAMYRRLRHDGVYRYVVDRAVPLHDHGGAFAGFMGQCVDIHDYRRRGHPGKEDDEFRFLADLIPHIIFTATPDGRNDFSNQFAADFIGVDADQLTGERWAAAVHPDERAELFDRWSRSMLTGEPFEMLYRFRRSGDGQYRWFLGRMAPLRGPDGRIVKWFGLNTDLHDQKLAEIERTELLEREKAARAEAEAANRMKDEFLATLSHELRTPLNAILGWIQLLRTETLTEIQRAHALDTIESSAKLQTQLVADILDVSRIITGKLRIEVKWVELKEVVTAAIETLLPAAVAKGIAIDLQVDPVLEPVRGDPERLQQVMWNLLSNAIKFCSRGGLVAITIIDAENMVEVIVADDGEGIPAEVLPHIFERFRQGDNSTKRRYGGLGLGLAIVRHLMELHGGTVDAHSRGQGMGATFRVQLPKLALTVPDPARESIKPEPTPDLAGLHVVVLDDDASLREILSLFLEGNGARVSSVASVAEAMRTVHTERPDAVISDISMPYEDGYDLVRQLREVDRAGQPIPALALTAHARNEERHRTLSAGFHAHMTKPVDMKELVVVVARLCGRR
jgi:PAS domain S-box-containing protein